MNLRHVDLNLLRLVAAVLREGSASGAARTLRISQPAVSQGMARARDVFRDPLVFRHGNRLWPTPRGAALLPELTAILDQIAAALSPDRFDPSTADREFTIASGDLGQVLVLPTLINQITRQAPLCRVKIVPPLTQPEQMPQIDLSVTGAPLGIGALHCQFLFDDHFVMLARADHPALSGPLEICDFLAVPQILVAPRAEGFDGPVDAALTKLGFRRRVAVMVVNFMSLPQILASSDLIAAVPSRLAGLAAFQLTCAHRPLPFPVPGFAMNAVWHSSRNADPALVWLRSLLP